MGPGVLSGLQNICFLTISLREFLHCCSFTKVHSMLVNITHLELLETGYFRGEVLDAHLPLLPRLTHLALDSIPLDLPFYPALRANKTLQYILSGQRSLYCAVCAPRKHPSSLGVGLFARIRRRIGTRTGCTVSPPGRIIGRLPRHSSERGATERLIVS
jgi:hypothetical protein